MTTEVQQDGAGTTQPGEQQNTDGVKPGEGAAISLTDDTKVEETKVEETKVEETKAEETKVDEAVTYEFTTPEGIQLDAGRLEKFTALATELKLPADKAQALVDMAVEVEVQRVEAFNKQKVDWVEELKADKELGGDKLLQNLATAKKVFSILPEAQAKELKDLLNATGLEANPAFFRFFHAVGTRLSEDSFVPAGSNPRTVDSLKSFYDKSNMN